MAEDDRPAKRNKYSGGFVTIRAGTGEKSEDFHVHEDVIKQQSEYFRRAFDAKWQEGARRTIELSEDSPREVAAYVEWLYSRTITVTSPKDLTTSDEKDDVLQHILRLYVFGEKIQDDTFCDDVLKTLLCSFCDDKNTSGHPWFPTTQDVAIIYDGTPEGSPARELMVYMHVCHGIDACIGDQYEENHPQFLIDLCKALMNKVAELDKKNSHRPLYELRDKWMKKTNK